eukprot:TRINITY_DN4032_c0_g1_i2.p1 TRINITY_DN4032_c0_g1~~TRINITY_DN4032_c0_g1_i2.p1  ORF type:complete len:564 (-),score=167.28 TRINITY_DN4032_c0_g1_i2:292-1983(-)
MGCGTSTQPEVEGQPSSKVRPRPATAQGTFLRILTVNDVYKLDNYSRLASAIKQNRQAAQALDCTFISCLPGDLLSPCIYTALDGGETMVSMITHATLDYICLGNHEYDLGFAGLSAKLREFPGKCLNSNDKGTPCLDWLPTHDLVQVGERCALLGGFCTPDKTIYSPVRCPELLPVDDAIVELWDKVVSTGVTPDVFVPLTHQQMHEDRSTCAVIAQHDSLKERTPVVLGGHEHEVYLEASGASTIVKVGADAALIGLIDVWWDHQGVLCSEVYTQPASEFAQDAQLQQFVDKKEAMLAEAMSVPIAQLPEPMSSMRVRFEPSKLASFLLTALKEGLAAEGVEIAMIQGGAVRGKAEYQAGPFTMGNLFEEFAFDCEQVILNLPGHIISDSAFNSRNMPKPAPNFLHFDEHVLFDGDGKICSVGGQAFEPDRLYVVSVYYFLVAGGNDVQPLLQYVQDNLTVPDQEACQHAKNVVLESMMKHLWRRVLGHTDTSSAEAWIEEVFAELDVDGNGSLDYEELMQGFGEKLDQSCATGMLKQMIKSLDTNGDGHVDMQELRAIIF